MFLIFIFFLFFTFSPPPRLRLPSPNTVGQSPFIFLPCLRGGVRQDGGVYCLLILEWLVLHSLSFVARILEVLHECKTQRVYKGTQA